MRKSNPYLIAIVSFLVTVCAIAPQASFAAAPAFRSAAAAVR